MDNNFSCGERLKELRNRHRVSQEELALRAGLSTNYIGMIERGTNNPTVKALEQICAALDMELCDFFCSGAKARKQECSLYARLEQLPQKDRSALEEIIERILELRQ